jgi:hypothetical protein
MSYFTSPTQNSRIAFSLLCSFVLVQEQKTAPDANIAMTKYLLVPFIFLTFLKFKKKGDREGRPYVNG